MKPVHQTTFGGEDAPESEQGNCMAACLASIFECTLADVPDFTGSIVSGGWFFHLQKWLATRNLSLLMLRRPAVDIPAGFAMASVDSETLGPGAHMVVLEAGKVVHDPNPRAKRKPGVDDYVIEEYWAFTVRDPAAMPVSA